MTAGTPLVHERERPGLAAAGGLVAFVHWMTAGTPLLHERERVLGLGRRELIAFVQRDAAPWCTTRSVARTRRRTGRSTGGGVVSGNRSTIMSAMPARFAGALVFVASGQRPGAGDAGRAPAGAVRRGVARDVHRRSSASSSPASPPGRGAGDGSPTASTPGRCCRSPSRSAARRRSPPCRSSGSSGPGADGSSPLTIIFLAGMAFFLPAALLSAVSPLTVKAQLRDVDHTGRVVGRVEALGTAGSLIGVFGTGFILVAEFPTTPVVIVLGGAPRRDRRRCCWLTRRYEERAPVDRRRRGRRRPAERRRGAGRAARASRDGATSAPGCEVDEARPSARMLWLDDLRHAYVDLDDPTYLEFLYTQLLGDVVDAMAPAGEPIDAVHLGGGGFTMPALRRGHPARLGQPRAGARPGRRAHRRGRARPRAVRPAAGPHRRRPRLPARRRRRQRRPRHRRRLRRAGRAVPPGDRGVRRRTSPGCCATTAIYAQNIIDRPPLRLPVGRRGHAARGVRPRRRARSARSLRRHRGRQLDRRGQRRTAPARRPRPS